MLMSHRAIVCSARTDVQVVSLPRVQIHRQETIGGAFVVSVAPQVEQRKEASLTSTAALIYWWVEGRRGTGSSISSRGTDRDAVSLSSPDERQLGVFSSSQIR